MQIINTNTSVKAIEFKSNQIMYEKERDGLKSNTIRIMFDIEYKMYIESKPRYIQIRSLDSKKRFVRRLNDVIDFYHNKVTGEHIVLFSWG